MNVDVQKSTAKGLVRRVCLATALTGVVLAWPVQSNAQRSQDYQLADLKALQAAFTKLADDVRPQVVAIQTYYTQDPNPGSQPMVKVPVSRGSGFIIDEKGYIATNRHVLEDANYFTVILNDGRKYDAQVVQSDPRSDLAVIRIEADGLQPVCLGDLGDVKVNQWTFAVGNPFGLAKPYGGMSITYGVVSALGRNMTRQLAGGSSVPYYGNLIETSSAINPGSSGGPLFNVDREVIGVVTAIETSSGANEGSGFAIPIDKNTRRILDTLKAGKTVRYGFLGIKIDQKTPSVSPLVVRSRVYPGVRIDEINVEDGPAEKAGLRPNDIIIEYDGVPVQSFDHLIRMVSFTPVGSEATVTYLRRNVKRKAKVILGDRYDLMGIDVPE